MSNKPQQKHIPLRSCIACREAKAKRELVRLVRTPENNVEIDRSGRKPGRGAYLCRETACWSSGLKGNRLENVLRTAVTPEQRARLLNEGKEFLQGAS